jgi:hypothetical protein
MKKEEHDKLRILFAEQIKIINNIQLNLDCDLYVCFEGEKEVPMLENKQAKLQKMKTELIKIFASLIAEF